ncbi:type VI secretion system tip protein VgrG, partial [Pseudomonas syringae pv. pisi]
MMLNPTDRPYFSLSIDGPEHDFQILSFIGHEAINQPFCFKLELVSERTSMDLESLLNCPAFLQYTSRGNGIHG